MKSNILSIAIILMDRYGKTSTKEVKDALHRLFQNDPTFQLTQKEVSETMEELYLEQSWERVLTTLTGTRISYYEYSLPQAIQSTQPAQTLTVTQATVAGGKLDENAGDYVCYVSGHPEMFVQATQSAGLTKQDCKRSTRNLCFNGYKAAYKARTGRPLDYNNLNFCTTKFYNKNVI